MLNLTHQHPRLGMVDSRLEDEEEEEDLVEGWNSSSTTIMEMLDIMRVTIRIQPTISRQFDHAIEYYHVFITKMQEKKTQTPTQNIQMVSAKLCEEDPNVNVVTRSGVANGEEKGKKLFFYLWI